jgi:hypothetical protein
MNVIITEQQLRLIEKLIKEEDGALLDDGSVKEYGDSSQIGTSAQLTDVDGNPKNGKDVYSDEIGKFASRQQWSSFNRGKRFSY